MDENVTPGIDMMEERFFLVIQSPDGPCDGHGFREIKNSITRIICKRHKCRAGLT